MVTSMRAVSSWGRLSQPLHDVHFLSDRRQVARQIQTSNPGVAYGMGRSYGDVCLNPLGVVWNTTQMDRFIDFDDTTGLLRCEAGVLFRDIQRLAVPRGWMLPVTPGTQFVTVGGAIASDVHGKNHHTQGTLGDHVRQLRLVRTDGQVIDCSPQQQPDWFAATVGGMGLTGVITEAAIQLRPVKGPWLETENIPYFNLDEFFHLADSSEAQWEHTVAWIDCVCAGGERGIFMRGNHCDSQKSDQKESQAHTFTMPCVPPLSLVNRLSLRPFNMAYFNLQKWRAGRTVTHYQPFFYPLDHVLEWNRIYGPKGFFQYQSVVPRAVGREAIQEMVRAISRSGDGSFLGVLKTFGERPAVGMMSFPQPGVTLALDFPNKGMRTLQLFERLDAIVREAGGRIYPAKDARMPKALFERGYPRYSEFIQYRDPKITSALSRRLMGS